MDVDVASDEQRSAERKPEPPPCDDWELDQQLQHIQHVLGSTKSNTDGTNTVNFQDRVRLDPPHGGPDAWHLPQTAASGQPVRRKPTQRHWMMAGLIWTALSLGTTTLVCGGILLGWSIWADRAELWDLGMPIALGGQIALLIGLVLQLDRLWNDSRQAADKLDDVDEQLHELKTTTTLLGTTRGPSSGAFYSHLADGAGPELLLSDLKGQLDLLAVKLMQKDSK